MLGWFHFTFLHGKTCMPWNIFTVPSHLNRCDSRLGFFFNTLKFLSLIFTVKITHLLSTWSLFLCEWSGFRRLSLHLMLFYLKWIREYSFPYLFCLVLDNLIWGLSSCFNSREQYFFIQCVHWMILTLFLLHVSNMLSYVVNKTDKVPNLVEMMRGWQIGKCGPLRGGSGTFILKWNASWHLNAKEPTTHTSEWGMWRNKSKQ